MKKRFLFTAMIIIILVMIMPAEYVLGDLACTPGSTSCSGTDLKTCFCEAGECAYIITSCLPGTCSYGACVTCNCDGRTCGSNTCGTANACGTCTSGICYNYNCCTPNCPESNCGQSDGCGGTCPNCCIPEGASCDDTIDTCCDGLICGGTANHMTCRTPPCSPACTTGFICESGTCVAQCTYPSYTKCSAGDVWGFNSCDIAIAKITECNDKLCVGNECTQSSCIADGGSCLLNSECCSAKCDTDKILDDITEGICVAGSSGGSSTCPSSWQISGTTFSNDANCGGNCVDHLDFNSFRMENGIIVETSVGEPNTFNGVCLVIKGQAYNAEKSENYYDECAGDQVRKYAVDGVYATKDRTVYADYPCEFGCSDGACKTSNSCSAEAGTCSSTSDCCEGYCTTAKKCCPLGSTYAYGVCVAQDKCGLASKCLFRPPNDPNGGQSQWFGSTLCIVDGVTDRACCYYSELYGEKDVYYRLSGTVFTY